MRLCFIRLQEASKLLDFTVSSCFILEGPKGGMKAGRIKNLLKKDSYFGITPPTFIPSLEIAGFHTVDYMCSWGFYLLIGCHIMSYKLHRCLSTHGSYALDTKLNPI